MLLELVTRTELPLYERLFKSGMFLRIELKQPIDYLLGFHLLSNSGVVRRELDISCLYLDTAI